MPKGIYVRIKTSGKKTSTSKKTYSKAKEKKRMNQIQNVLMSCHKAGIHVLLTGRPGISKSTTAIRTALQLTETKKVACIVLPEDTPVAELRGFYMPHEDGKFKWVDGPVTAMIRVGGICILDELSHLSPEAQTFLHSALDDSPLTLPTGDTVDKHKEFWCVATQNDTMEVLRPAMMDRFPVRIDVKNPPPDVYAALPEDLRDPAQRQVEGEKGSLRPWFAFARLREHMDEREAAELLWPKRGNEMMTAIKLTKAA